MEIWKDCAIQPEFYEVSSLGNVRSKARFDSAGMSRKQRMLKLSTTKDGYKKTHFFINGKARHFFVHRLVYHAFVGPIPEGFEINHRNGIRHDNRPKNLEALTHADNVRYSKNHLGADYATYGNGRMTPEQREQILYLRNQQKIPFHKIAKLVGFSKSQVINVCHGKCWSI